MYIFNSLSKKKELFAPIKDNIVNIYSCGSTVYDYSHLGHARNAIVFDLLHRVLKQNKYKVFFVKNYTDIDDKIINKANDKNISIQELSEFYIQAEDADMNSLSILTPDIQPKATQYIESMISLIDKLLLKDIAYVIDNGVYFDTSKDSKYGSISNRAQEDSTDRVEKNKQKRNSKDFVLWKFEDKKDISYEASFGRGRPGWHTECSAMIYDIFDKDENSEHIIDIHCGGSDLLFPHHENEATQIRCLNNQEIAKYWMHNGFVQIDNEKMSKSLGNSLYLKDVLGSHHSEVVRLYLLSVHYRANFNFTDKGLLEAKKTLNKLYRLKKIAYDTPATGDFKDDSKTIDNIMNALSDDMNVSEAMSYINEFASNCNDFLTNTKDKKCIKDKKIIISSFFVFLKDTLGILGENPYEYFRFGLDKSEIQEINELLEQRQIYRQDKNYEQADKIKEILVSRNVSIMDMADSTQWEKI